MLRLVCSFVVRKPPKTDLSRFIYLGPNCLGRSSAEVINKHRAGLDLKGLFTGGGGGGGGSLQVQNLNQAAQALSGGVGGEYELRGRLIGGGLGGPPLKFF